MNETAPRPISGLGATRPSWCPPASVPRDVCEIKYPMDLPIIGVTEVGLPIYRVTYDAMKAATQRLPEFLPEIYDAVNPYVERLQGEIIDRVVRTAEYEADYLSDKLLRDKVDPRVAAMTDDIERRAQKITNEALLTGLALTGAVLLGGGVAIWWLKQKRS